MTPADDDAQTLVTLAREIAGAIPDFQAVKGAGAGDHATADFMKELRDQAAARFGHDYSECKLCGDTDFAVDFYLPHVATVIEVALGLPTSLSEYEKDILKAIVARDFGHKVDRLVFISRAGADKKCRQPGRTAIREWAFKAHGLRIEIHELPGKPRKRVRKRKSSLL